MRKALNLDLKIYIDPKKSTSFSDIIILFLYVDFTDLILIKIPVIIIIYKPYNLNP